MIKIGLDTESLHLWFQNKRMDIFGFIEKAHELGFDGVMINILKDYNLDPEWGSNSTFVICKKTAHTVCGTGYQRNH